MRAKILTAILYTCTGTACVLLFSPFTSKLAGFPSPGWPRWGEPAFWPAFVVPAVFLLSAILVVLKPWSSHLLGVIASALALHFFLPREMQDYHFVNSWSSLNQPGPARILVAPCLNLLTVILVIVATIHSLLRLAPGRWRIRNKPVREKNWPTFAISFTVICIWYFTAVSPYRIPIWDLYDSPPLFRVVHVEKRGLRFHEASLIVERDGRFWLLQDNRMLFEYSFEETSASGDVPAEDMETIAAVAHSRRHQVFDKTRNVSPWTWSADRWFIYSEQPPTWSVANVDGKEVPREILDWFAKTLKKTRQTDRGTFRDVCLGFCFFQGPPLVTH